jgi:transposase
MSRRARRSRIIKPDVLVVGIDVAKRRHVALCRRPDGLKEKPFAFANNRSGFEKLLGKAEDSKRRTGCCSLLFALEATGHYGHALRQFLADEGHGLVGINPAHTKWAKELEDNSPEKSDPKDAGLIADLAAQGRGRPLMIPRGAFADLRRLGKLRQRLVAERTRLTNRYHGLVDLVLPELAGIVRDVACRTMLRMFRKWPTAADIVQAEDSVFEDQLWRWSRGHIERTRIAEIRRVAKDGVGLRDGLKAAKLEMRQLLAGLERVAGDLAEVEGAQEEMLLQVPYARLLLSVPGLGPVSVAIILGETGDLRSYTSAEALIKLAGFNLYRIASGAFKGKTRITKRGRPLLRHQLFLAALRLGRRGGALEDFHDRLRARKVGPQVAVGGSRKLLRLLFALVRDDQVYEPGRLGVSLSAA